MLMEKGGCTRCPSSLLTETHVIAHNAQRLAVRARVAESSRGREEVGHLYDYLVEDLGVMPGTLSLFAEKFVLSGFTYRLTWGAPATC